MMNTEEKFTAIFDENDDLTHAGQLSSAASSSNIYDFKKKDVVLVALPETDDLWEDLTED